MNSTVTGFDPDTTNIINKCRTIPFKYFEQLQNSITEEKIKNFYSKLREHEVQGNVNREIFIFSMEEIFNEDIKSYFEIKQDITEEYLHQIYQLMFLRFRHIKCIMQNNKYTFYLIKLQKEEYINTYNVVCALVIFSQSCFENKIKLLFNFSDIDEDSFLNANEIKNMIETVNFLFCEEGIKSDSSILSQSLTNLKVNNILKEIFYDPGNLYLILSQEKYITFDVFYRSIKKIKDYKCKIMPSFLNLRKSLFNIKNEKQINIKNKHKTDFVNISSVLIPEKSTTVYGFPKLQKNFSVGHLKEIMKPVKIKEDDDILKNKPARDRIMNFFRDTFKSKAKTGLSFKKMLKNILNKHKNRSKEKKKKKKNKLVIEKTKSFFELVNENVINEDAENSKNNENANKNFNKSIYYNTDKSKVKYIFEANFEEIKNIEVEPGIITFKEDEVFVSPSKKPSSLISHNFLLNNNVSKCSSGKKIITVDILKKSPTKKNSLLNKENENDKVSSLNKIIKNVKLVNNSKTPKSKNFNFKNTSPISAYKNSVDVTPKNYIRMNSLIKNNLAGNKTFMNERKIIEFPKVNENSYKTLDEVFSEILSQEKKVNLEYNGNNISLYEGLSKIKNEKNDVGKLLGESEAKDYSLAFHKIHYNRLGNKGKNIFRRASKTIYG